MEKEPKKWIMVLVGPPGAGKGTQAELLAEDFGLFHLESSKVIEEKFKNGDPNDPVIQREKELWKSGKLNTPQLVCEWILEKVREVESQGRGIVFSGSPRTMYEAECELPEFEKFYGKENVKAINIEISEEESIKRNSKRRLCQANRHPIPNFPEYENITVCPKDGSPIITRALDNPDTIKVRFKTYWEETQPVVGFLRKRGYPIIEITGAQGIEHVHDDIVHKLFGLPGGGHKEILEGAKE